MILQDAQATYSGTNVGITTTTEQVITTSPLCHTYRNSAIVMIWAYCTLTLAASTTGITQRIRRGTTITDTLVNEANVSQIQTAASSNEHYAMVCFEQLSGEQIMQYCHTVQQAAGGAGGTSLEGSICILVI